MITLDAPTITAIASIIALLIVAGGGLYRLGKLGNQVEQLQVQVRDVRDEMRDEMSNLREEMRDDMNNLREEMRRNHQQLLAALANHSHDEQGHAVFRMPPGAEPQPGT